MPADPLPAAVFTAAACLGWLTLGLAVLQYGLYTGQTVLAFLEMRRNRKEERRGPAGWIIGAKSSPGISLLVPACNEERTIVQNIRSLLTLRYPRYEIIVVNDGSKDGTARAVIEAFKLERVPLRRPHPAPCQPIRGVYRHRDHPNLLFIDKENGGKSDALNAAMNYAGHPLVCGVDADSLLDHNSLLKAARPFVEQPHSLIAVGGTIRIANGCEVHGGMVINESAPRKLLPLFQIVEYLRAFLIARLSLSRMNTVAIISGAFGLFKRSAVLDAGGYTHGTVGEDMELIVKLHRLFQARGADYKILFVPDPVCWTEAPETLAVLRRQRTRWQRGLCEVLWRHRDMLFNPRHGRMGVIGLPLFVLFDLLGPFLDLAGLLLIPLFWICGLLSFKFMAAFFAVVVLYGVFLSMLALVLGELALFRTTRKRDMALLALGAIAENFGYRQLNILWRIEGIWQFLRKQKGWGEMTRTGLGRKQPAGPA
ncbi:MAG: glycosyltransferase family 2 protein [Opitutae bacterium]|nr:glycosyltransferase family 2 protein [Opitutae bacterium]